MNKVIEFFFFRNYNIAKKMFFMKKEKRWGNQIWFLSYDNKFLR